MSLVLRVVKNDFGNIGSALESRVETVVKKSAFDIEARAKAVVPVGETGNLKASIKADVQGTSAIVGVGMLYGPRIEYGFVGADSLGRVYNQAAQPYLTPAVEAVRPSFNAALRQIFGGS